MRIRNVVEKRLSNLQTKLASQPGVIGNLATGVVEVPGRTAMIYVTLTSGLLLENVLNVRVPNLFGLQVNVGFDPNNQPRTLQVLSARDLNYFAVDNPANGPAYHHKQHEWPYGDTVYVWGEQFLPALFVPHAGELSVDIYPNTYLITGGFKQYTQATNVDLSTLAGTVTTGYALWAVIVVDASGDFQIRPGDPVAEQASPFISAYLMLADTDLPDLTVGDTPICAVKLYYEQTEFHCNGNQNDFLDLRFAGGSSGGSSGIEEAPIDGTPYSRQDADWVSSPEGTGTNLGWYDAKEDGGLYGDGSHDDTTALQALIDTATDDGARSAVIYFPPGTYVIGGALQDTGDFNSQILLPDVPAYPNPQITIHFIGAARPPFAVHGVLPTPNGYSIIKSTLTGATGTGAVFSAGNGSPPTQNNISVVIDNLLCVGPDNPSFTFWNLSTTQGGAIHNLLISVATWLTASQNTHSNACGIRLPQPDNSNYTYVDGLCVGGWYTGLVQGELAICRGLIFGLCIVAVELPGAIHASMIVDMQQTGCTYGIKVTGENYCDILQYDAEHYTTGYPTWQNTVYDLDDANNYLHGHIRWFGVVIPGAVADHSFTVNGGANTTNSEVGKLLPNSGVSPNTYGDASHIPSIAVDIYGRITSASDEEITIPHGIQVDQSGGTSDTYGILAGVKNGSNTTFTVSGGAYDTGMLFVYLNGQLQTQGSAEDWVETAPGSGTFDFIVPPEATDIITAIYGGGFAGVEQFYDSVALASDQVVTSLVDLTGLSMAKTLEDGVLYRWRFDYKLTKTSLVGTVFIFITDGSNNSLEQKPTSVPASYWNSGILEYVEEGTGAAVTRKVRASVDNGNCTFEAASDIHCTFSVEKCG